MKNIVLLGAYSAIVFETARLYAKEGANFVLLGRDQHRLEQTANDLRARGAGEIKSISSDLANTSTHDEIFSEIIKAQANPDLVILGYGSLPDQAACQKDFASAADAININFLSAVSWVEKFAALFEQRQAGAIAVITSVAGDRGRKSNYVYGASKGALGLYLQGVRNRLGKSGVQVLTIKPGFVDTPMTKELKKGLLFASPEKIATGIYSAIAKKREIVYLPCFWQIIMLIICLIPEKIFKKMSI